MSPNPENNEPKKSIPTVVVIDAPATEEAQPVEAPQLKTPQLKARSAGENAISGNP